LSRCSSGKLRLNSSRTSFYCRSPAFVIKKSTTYSQTTVTGTNAILVSLRINVATKPPPQQPSGTFNDFNWPEGQNETESTASALEHIKNELRSFDPNLQLGSQRDDQLYWQLVDVHNATSALTVENNEVRLRGTTDLMIVPSNHDPQNPAGSASVVIQLKKPTGSDFDIFGFGHKACLELIGASTLSSKPVMAIVTDLKSGDTGHGAVVCTATCDHGVITILKHHIHTLSQMAEMIRDFLGQMTPDAIPVLTFNEPPDNAPLAVRGSHGIKRLFSQLDDCTEHALELMQDEDPFYRREGVKLLFQLMGEEQPVICRATEQGENAPRRNMFV